MKISGQSISKPKNEIVVIPREEGNIVFEAQAVLDYTKFNELCSEPSIPTRNYPDGRQEKDPSDRTYLQKRDRWAAKKSAWLIIESLAATTGLEWELVNLEDPETWTKYDEELESQFAQGEVNAIIDAVFKANSIDDSRLEEAKAHFLAEQQQA